MMKAYTIWPEWSWAICELGKDIENRSKRPPRTLEVGDDLAIHAGANFGGTTKHQKIGDIFDPVAAMARDAGWRMAPERQTNSIQVYNVRKSASFNQKVHEIPRGAVVAVAIFGGYLGPESGEQKRPWWAEGSYGYILDAVAVLQSPVACRGQQGIWNLDEATERLVRDELIAGRYRRST